MASQFRMLCFLTDLLQLASTIEQIALLDMIAFDVLAETVHLPTDWKAISSIGKKTLSFIKCELQPDKELPVTKCLRIDQYKNVKIFINRVEANLVSLGLTK